MADDIRLVSWKRIARYLERGERTVRRWAAEDGLPVHRVSASRNSSVFAFTKEIDAWLHQPSFRSTPRPPSGRPVLALLPVENLSGLEMFEPVVDGLTEEVISVLGQLEALGVIARTSVMQFKGGSLSISEIGRRLRAQYVIEGSMRTEGNVARVTMQLIDVADQTHLWAKNYEHSLDSLMALQRDIAIGVASDVATVLTGKRPTLESPPPAITGPGADAYARGRVLLNGLAVDSLRDSVAAFDRAIALEPEFGPAYGGKAEALQLLTNFGQISPADVMPDAMQAISNAIAYSPNSAEVFASLGYIHSTYSREWTASERAFQRSLTLNPSLGIAHQWYAEALAILGRFEEAMHHGREAQRLDPLSIAVECSIGHVLWLARRYDELLIAMQTVVGIEPNFPLAHILLFSAHFERGDYSAALDACETAIQQTGDAMPFMMFSALAQGAAGEPEHIVQCMNMLHQQSADIFVSNFFFGLLTSTLGETEAAIEYLDKACDEGVWLVNMLGQSAMFDGLRQSESFNELLRRIGLYESRYFLSETGRASTDTSNTSIQGNL